MSALVEAASVRHNYLHMKHTIWDCKDFGQAWHAICSRYRRYRSAVTRWHARLAQIPQIPNDAFHIEIVVLYRDPNIISGQVRSICGQAGPKSCYYTPCWTYV